VMGLRRSDKGEAVVAARIRRVFDSRPASVDDSYPLTAGIVQLAPGMSLCLDLPRIRYGVKRGIDILASGVALLFMLPVFAVIALAIRLSSPGPIFFRQSRVGRGGTFFEVLKFRTMQADAANWLENNIDLTWLYEANDFKVPLALDHRVTPLGRVLRRTSLDELPQLINVFLGQMSLVGPRPVVPDELTRYGPLVPAYLAVRPGITGAWQVGGRSLVNYPDRAVMDFCYVVRWGLLLDLAIMLRTIPAVFGQKGAY
jgi:exopolysaccharide production protein ExoY